MRRRHTRLPRHTTVPVRPEWAWPGTEELLEERTVVLARALGAALAAVEAGDVGGRYEDIEDPSERRPRCQVEMEQAQEAWVR